MTVQELLDELRTMVQEHPEAARTTIYIDGNPTTISDVEFDAEDFIDGVGVECGVVFHLESLEREED